MSGELNLLDLLFIALLFFSVFFGLLRGLVRELLSLFFLIAALVVAFIYYREAGLLLHGLIDNRDLANFAGFLLILALVAAVGSLVTGLIGKHLVVGPLKAVDRLLGAVFGLAAGHAAVRAGHLQFPGVPPEPGSARPFAAGARI